MSVRLRLARKGDKGRPFYRIVAADWQNPRDGKYLEIVGTYNPRSNPPACALKEDLIKKWVGNGAKPTLIVKNLIIKNIPGLIEKTEEHQKKKIQEARRKRKERAKKASAKK